MNGINGINGNFGSAATWMEKIVVQTGRTDIQTKNLCDKWILQNNVPHEHEYFQCAPGSSYPFYGMVWDYEAESHSQLHESLSQP